MDPIKTFLSSIAATSAMTAFSYLITDGKSKNYKEPELLASLLENGRLNLSKSTSTPAGWAAHYAFGLAWALVHEMILSRGVIKRNPRTGLLFGAFGGITGIVTWGLLFKLSPRPPRIDYRSFYSHLVIAQIIFSTTFLALSKNSNT